MNGRVITSYDALCVCSLTKINEEFSEYNHVLGFWFYLGQVIYYLECCPLNVFRVEALRKSTKSKALEFEFDYQ